MKALLKQQRTSKGFTQGDMAKLLDCTEQYYHMIENGHRRPSPMIAKKIGRFLDIDWTLFYKEEQ